MLLPSTGLFVPAPERMSTPALALLPITLPSPALTPPMRLPLPALMRTPSPPLPSGVLPSAATPMALPMMMLFEPLIAMPALVLPDMTLRSAAVMPPMVLDALVGDRYKPPPLPRALLPSVPRWLPAIRLFAESMRMALNSARVISSPRTVLPLDPLASTNRSLLGPPPSSMRTSGTPAKPGWLLPSITTASVTVSAVPVTVMVAAPLPIAK